MKAICINGKPTDPQIHLIVPEGIPLEVSQSDKFPESFLVPGYQYCPATGKTIHWKKHRFIPLSDKDETELIKERENQLQEL